MHPCSYDGVSAGIWVIHTKVANLGVTLFDSYSYDGVSAGIWVIHTYIHVCLYKFELTVAHLCPITACGMVSFGGLLSE